MTIIIEINIFIFLLGKTSLIAKFRKSKCLQNLAATFLKNDATKEEIQNAGVEIFQKK